MRQYHRLSRFERWLQEARDYIRALCEALMLDCLALVVLWFFEWN